MSRARFSRADLIAEFHRVRGSGRAEEQVDMAWWCPAACRTTWFRSKEPIGERHGVTPHPALVFIVRERDWYVCAEQE